MNFDLMHFLCAALGFGLSWLLRGRAESNVAIPEDVLAIAKLVVDRRDKRSQQAALDEVHAALVDVKAQAPPVGGVKVNP